MWCALPFENYPIWKLHGAFCCGSANKHAVARDRVLTRFPKLHRAVRQSSASLRYSPVVRQFIGFCRDYRDIFITATRNDDRPVQTSFTLSKGSTRAIVDGKDGDDRIALIYGVDDSVGALFLAKKQMAKFLVFPEFTDPRPGYRSKLELLP
jgi:hypothetical protein